MDALLYNGEPMQPNMHAIGGRYGRMESFEGIRATVRAGTAVHFSLQPGDATAYELLIAPLASPSQQEGIVIVRLRGGDAEACAELWDWTTGASTHQLQDAAAKLSLGDDWSYAIMMWWLDQLCATDA